MRVVHLIGARAADGSWLPAGHDPADALRRIAPDIARAEVYLCGPEGWTRAARAAVRAAGVADRRVHTELFSW